MDTIQQALILIAFFTACHFWAHFLIFKAPKLMNCCVFKYKDKEE